MLTVGKFAVVDIFDTNKYANNPKSDFLNWSLINAGTFDYAGDGWGYTYGAAAEWYQGRFTLRGGVFDLSATPAGGVSPAGYGLDPTFNQFQLVGEIEERHELWGQPGKLKITGFLSPRADGRFPGCRSTLAPGDRPEPADHRAVRIYTSRPGVSLNLEQQVTETSACSPAPAGPTATSSRGISPTSTAPYRQASPSTANNGAGLTTRSGIAGVINGISGVHAAFFNAGGLGILIGDGQLPNPGLEQIIETYYSYALSASTQAHLRLSVHRQPGLQRRPRAGECFCRAVSRSILSRVLNAERRQRGY